MYGARGSVTEEVATAVQTIQKHSEVKIYLQESTGSPKSAATSKESTDLSLLEVKRLADQFYRDADAGKHKYYRLCD